MKTTIFYFDWLHIVEICIYLFFEMQIEADISMVPNLPLMGQCLEPKARDRIDKGGSKPPFFFVCVFNGL